MNGLPAGRLLRRVAATTAVAASALAHLGWWLDWHTSGAGRGSRSID